MCLAREKTPLYTPLTVPFAGPKVRVLSTMNTTSLSLFLNDRVCPLRAGLQLLVVGRGGAQRREVYDGIFNFVFSSPTSWTSLMLSFSFEDVPALTGAVFTFVKPKIGVSSQPRVLSET